MKPDSQVGDFLGLIVQKLLDLEPTTFYNGFPSDLRDDAESIWSELYPTIPPRDNDENVPCVHHL